MFGDICTSGGTFFITATGTDIGKTYIACRMIEAWRANGLSVCVKKPLISGVTDETIADSDTGLLLRANNLAITPENVRQTSPFRFIAPQSPDIAARAEGRSLTKAQLLQASQPDSTCDVTLIEGAGGIMVPVCEGYTTAEWIYDIGAQALIVGGCYVGGLSHMLTALITARYYRIPVRACVVNARHTHGSHTPMPDFMTSLRAYTGDIPVYTINDDTRKI